MQYDLVFEGGGAKGMAFVGALEAFEARGHHRYIPVRWHDPATLDERKGVSRPR